MSVREKKIGSEIGGEEREDSGQTCVALSAGRAQNQELDINGQLLANKTTDANFRRLLPETSVPPGYVPVLIIKQHRQLNAGHPVDIALKIAQVATRRSRTGRQRCRLSLEDAFVLKSLEFRNYQGASSGRAEQWLPCVP